MNNENRYPLQCPRSEMVAGPASIQQLLKLGVKIPCNHFFWVLKKRNGWQVHFPGINQYNEETMLPAPTVVDLFNALPPMTHLYNWSASFNVRTKNKGLHTCFKAQYKLITTTGVTPADALANLLIALITANVISVVYVNEMLVAYHKHITSRS